MKTTILKLNDAWCVNRHTGDFDDSVEWYSLFHHHGTRQIEVGYENEKEGCLDFENCPFCNKPVPDEVAGFLTLCEWETS